MKKLLWLVPALSVFSCVSVGADDKMMKPYPAATDGQQRFVITLEPQSDETQYKIEILAGKTIPVDCNRVSIGGELSQKIAQGWGYPYYVVENVGPPISTKMACPPEQSPKPTFVPVRSETALLRYNSKLPVVVYAPEGFEVRYRIWQAGSEKTDAAQR